MPLWQLTRAFPTGVGRYIIKGGFEMARRKRCTLEDIEHFVSTAVTWEITEVLSFTGKRSSQLWRETKEEPKEQKPKTNLRLAVDNE